MYLKALTFFILVKTPLHVGSGSELGVVDLPIQRERTTGFPKIESSSLKGSLRSALEFASRNLNDKECASNNIQLAFGPDEVSDEGSNYKGALSFTEARLLLFPLKSAKGVFVWVTSPMLLKRFKEDLEIIGESNEFAEIMKNVRKNTSSSKEILLGDNDLVIEDYLFSVSEDNNTKEVAKFIKRYVNINDLEEKLVILGDDELRDFTAMSTEVIARTKINDDTGIVQEGALWYEEFVPEKTVFYSIALAGRTYKENDNSNDSDMLKFFKECINRIKYLQIGGDATIGKGICEIAIMNAEESNE